MDPGALAAKAAGGGDTAWLLVYLLAAAATLLLGIVGFFIKKNFSDRERKEQLLERRLAAGSDTMTKLKEEFKDAMIGLKEEFHTIANEFHAEIVRLNASDVDQCIRASKLLERKEFDEFRDQHKEEHECIKKNMDDFRDSLDFIQNKIDVSVSQMTGCVEAMKDLTAKFVGAVGK